MISATLGARRRKGSSRLGRAAKACKGRKRGAFKACVRSKMRGH